MHMAAKLTISLHSLDL